MAMASTPLTEESDAKGDDSGPLPPQVDLTRAPKPRRFARIFTLVVMLVTLAISVLVAIQMVPEARYAFEGNTPHEVGTLDSLALDENNANRLVHATGLLTTEAIRYERPLSPGEYWLVPAVGRPDLWVEVHVPDTVTAEEFVPPRSFVGRLAPLGSAGPRYRVLGRAAQMLERGPTIDPWILIDGDTPRGSRWAVAVCAMLVLFAFFNLWGIFRLTRKVG